MTVRNARPEPRRRRPVEPEPRGGLSISPGVVFLAIAVIGSIAYFGYTVTVRDASQIPLLASGAVVLAIAFGALAIYSLRATLRAGQEDRGQRALLIALVGGGAAIAASGFVAGAIILFQVASGPG